MLTVRGNPEKFLGAAMSYHSFGQIATAAP